MWVSPTFSKFKSERNPIFTFTKKAFLVLMSVFHKSKVESRLWKAGDTLPFRLFQLLQNTRSAF